MRTILLGLICVLGLNILGQERKIVIGDEREKRPDLFQPLPSLPATPEILPRPHSLEFVHIRNNRPQEEDELMVKFLSPATIAEIKRLRLDWLMLRKFDIQLSSIKVEGNKLSFELFVDVRYSQYGNLMVNGTVTGGFTAEFDGQELTSFEQTTALVASKEIEEALLNIWRASSYDLRPLLANVVVETMSKTLSQPSTADKVRAMAQPEVRNP